LRSYEPKYKVKIKNYELSYANALTILQKDLLYGWLRAALALGSLLLIPTCSQRPLHLLEASLDQRYVVEVVVVFDYGFPLHQVMQVLVYSQGNLLLTKCHLAKVLVVLVDGVLVNWEGHFVVGKSILNLLDHGMVTIDVLELWDFLIIGKSHDFQVLWVDHS